MKRLLTTILSLLLAYNASAQLLHQEVSFHYVGTPLEDALAEISDTYGVPFSYSPKRLPIHEPVTAFVQGVPLSEGLEELFAELPVAYKELGGQIVLKPDRAKELKLLSQLKLPEMPPQRVTKVPIVIPEKKEETPVDEPENKSVEASISSVPVRDTTFQKPLEPMEMPAQKEVLTSGGELVYPSPDVDWSLFMDTLNRIHGDEDKRLAQASILPGLGTNRRHKRVTNNMSFNLLWGNNGGVNGVEIGVLGNTVQGDVKGMQAAGLVNDVHGHLYGTQMAGILNKTSGGAGLQVAGFVNVVQQEFKGAQISLLYNTAWVGETHFQTALVNSADSVRMAQIGLINNARTVRGLQLGLINKADTVSGLPIALLNFINKGYNRIELSRGDLFQMNIGAKFGAYRFYNILHVGLHYENSPFGKEGNWQKENISWSIGYGIGTAKRIGKRGLFNVELVGSQVHEKSYWLRETNFLGQLKAGLDFRIFGSFSVFGSATLNGLYSQRYDSDTNSIGSQLPVEPYINRTENGWNKQFWVGYSLGIRF